MTVIKKIFRKKEDASKRSRYASMAAAAFLMLFVSIAGLSWVHEAQALRISMKRIIFEGPKRSDIITIMNNTAKEQVYRLGWRHYRMDEQRSLVYLEEGDPAIAEMKWADDMIKFAPRRVTVPPGGSQQIRVLLRRPRDLEVGEYRSHLWIVTESDVEAFVADPSLPPKATSFRLAMLPALSMPVFVRHGDLKASAKITDMQLVKTDGGSAISFVLHREGNRSLYGDLHIVCTAGGQEYQAHQVRGIAVYTEVSKRIFDFDVNYPPEQTANCASMRIEYVADRDDSLYSGKTMAQAQASH